MLVLNLAKGENTEDLVSLYQKSFEHSKDYILALKEIDNYMFKYINDSNKFAYLLKDDDKYIGFILAYVVPDMINGEAIFIDNLGVSKEYQKMGYGKKMMNLFFQEMKNENYYSFYLNTFNNIDAFEFYKKIGFQVMSDRLVSMNYNIKGGSYDDLIGAINNEITENVINKILEYKENNLSEDEAAEELIKYLKIMKKK